MTTWFKMDDGFDEHPKVIGLSDAAYRLAVSALCYSSRNLTDGLILAAVATRLAPHADTAELVDAGLWVTHPSRSDAFVIHNYTERNRTADQVRTDRDAAAQRQRDSRERRKQQEQAKASHRDNGVSHNPVTAQETESETYKPTPQPPEPEHDDATTPVAGEDEAEAMPNTDIALAHAATKNTRLAPNLNARPLAKAITERATELNANPLDVASWLNTNLTTNPVPADVARPWGFLQFRLAQIDGPPPPPQPATVPAADSQVLARYEQPTDADRSALEAQTTHNTEEPTPTMDTATARAAARAVFTTPQAAAS